MTAGGGVDVLAVMDSYSRVFQPNEGRDGADMAAARELVAELIAAVQDERILRDLGADVDSKTLASAMRRTSAALRNCRASTLTGAAQ